MLSGERRSGGQAMAKYMAKNRRAHHSAESNAAWHMG